MPWTNPEPISPSQLVAPHAFAWLFLSLTMSAADAEPNEAEHPICW